MSVFVPLHICIFLFFFLFCYFLFTYWHDDEAVLPKLLNSRKSLFRPQPRSLGDWWDILLFVPFFIWLCSGLGVICGFLRVCVPVCLCYMCNTGKTKDPARTPTNPPASMSPITSWGSWKEQEKKGKKEGSRNKKWSEVKELGGGESDERQGERRWRGRWQVSSITLTHV